MYFDLFNGTLLKICKALEQEIQAYSAYSVPFTHFITVFLFTNNSWATLHQSKCIYYCINLGSDVLLYK